MSRKPLTLGPISRAAAVRLGDYADAAGITRVRIAVTVGLSEATISRIFNLRRPMTIDEFEAIAGALGLVGWRILREIEAEGDIGVRASRPPVVTAVEVEAESIALAWPARQPPAESDR